ncbi:hypothetical protein HK101_010952 [Irineochytrium annulatum]|nr:hypothetical protein HK101_010952 [Irineochytrium annulatum]
MSASATDRDADLAIASNGAALKSDVVLNFAFESIRPSRPKPATTSVESTPEGQGTSSSAASSSAASEQVVADPELYAGSQLNSAADVVFLTLHGVLLSLGFKFVGLGERQMEPSKEPSALEDAMHKPSQSKLPPHWNQTGDTFSQRYTHPRSSLTFLLKGVKIADRLLVHCLAVQDNKLHTLDFLLPSLISTSAVLPLTPTMDSPNPLPDLFTSPQVVDDLIFKFKTQIIDQVAPALLKDGYEPITAQAEGAGPGVRPHADRNPDAERRRREYEDDPLRDPSFGPPRRPMPGYPGGRHNPYGEDDFGPPGFGRNPFAIGDVDLDPFSAGEMR